LLLVGPRTAALFASELGATLKGEPKVESRHLAHHDTLTPVNGQMQDCEFGAQTKSFGRLHSENSVDSPSQPAAVITPLGKGQIAATCFDLGQDYARSRPPGLRQFVNDLARELFPKPMVEVRGSTDVDVTLARNQGQLLVNLVNTGGPHQTAGIIEAIPPVGPLAVTIRQPTMPAKVILEPGGKSLPFDYRADEIQLTLPRLEIHNIIVVRSN
jgi:hypothetical protein